MRKLRKTIILILVLALLFTGCTPVAETSDVNEHPEQTTNQTQQDEEQNIAEDVDISEGTTVEEGEIVDEPSEEEVLNEEQKNSVAMLNYLATLSQEINASKNSRMFLEEAYASLINNTNPEKVNELTESHMSSLLDIIEKYRLINVKRERLQYIYDQNKAMAIKEAIPNPVALLSAASSLDLKRLAGSVIYMAVDSYSSYKSYNNELDNEFLQDGWALDDEEAANLHDSRKRAFMFMIEIVREDNLPGELALSESAVESFVKWKNNENVSQRLQFLESEENTYKAFGNYWLELAECYYEKGNYDKCLESVAKYEELQSDIFRKDYYLAQIMPKTIVAASEVYSEKEYIPVAEKFLDILMENTESTEWSLRYFAAQMYLDLYAKTSDSQYMTKAYNIALNNVNYLIEEQKSLNSTYLADVKEVSIPDDATKEEKKQIKEYNKSLKTERKTELPSVYAVLLFANIPVQTLAFERRDHDKYMSEVLFKNFKVIENDPEVQDEVDVLESACYLMIDQFNSNGQKDLDILINYGVKNIPEQVSEISFNASGTTHRTYTHKGWESSFYMKSELEESSWIERQAIMMNTVDKVFDFDGNTKKQESFCKVLYYIHILGDHKDDKSWKTQNGLKMGVGGRTDNNDIIHELLEAFEVLFADQKHTHKYRSLTSNLQEIDSKPPCPALAPLRMKQGQADSFYFFCRIDAL